MPLAAGWIAPRIRGLFCLVRPATVARLVVTCNVYAVQRSPYGSLAHIGEEVFKVNPVHADHRSELRVLATLRTPLMHRLPGDIGRSTAHSMPPIGRKADSTGTRAHPLCPDACPVRRRLPIPV